MQTPKPYECGTAEATPTPKFTTFQIADVSTAHITEQDGRLLSNPLLCGHTASIDPLEPGGDPPGDIFTIPQDPEIFKQQLEEFSDKGFSEAFLNLFKHLREQKIHYVKIDADGIEVPGLPTFDW